jgi:hypothetical protein
VLREIEVQLIGWFESLTVAFDKIAANEDKRALKASLADLDKSIYDLETNGRYLVWALERQPVVEQEVQRGVEDTRSALGKVATQLHAVGILLRSEYRAGGADAERLIAHAVGRRTAWLHDVEVALQKHNVTPELIAEGRAVLAMQGTASGMLIRVIERL